MVKIRKDGFLSIIVLCMVCIKTDLVRSNIVSNNERTIRNLYNKFPRSIYNPQLISEEDEDVTRKHRNFEKVIFWILNNHTQEPVSEQVTSEPVTTNYETIVLANDTFEKNQKVYVKSDETEEKIGRISRHFKAREPQRPKRQVTTSTTIGTSVSAEQSLSSSGITQVSGESSGVSSSVISVMGSKIPVQVATVIINVCNNNTCMNGTCCSSASAEVTTATSQSEASEKTEATITGVTGGSETTTVQTGGTGSIIQSSQTGKSEGTQTTYETGSTGSTGSTSETAASEPTTFSLPPLIPSGRTLTGQMTIITKGTGNQFQFRAAGLARGTTEPSFDKKPFRVLDDVRSDSNPSIYEEKETNGTSFMRDPRIQGQNDGMLIENNRSATANKRKKTYVTLFVEDRRIQRQNVRPNITNLDGMIIEKDKSSTLNVGKETDVKAFVWDPRIQHQNVRPNITNLDGVLIDEERNVTVNEGKKMDGTTLVGDPRIQWQNDGVLIDEDSNVTMKGGKETDGTALVADPRIQGQNDEVLIDEDSSLILDSDPAQSDEVLIDKNASLILDSDPAQSDKVGSDTYLLMFQPSDSAHLMKRSTRELLYYNRYRDGIDRYGIGNEYKETAEKEYDEDSSKIEKTYIPKLDTESSNEDSSRIEDRSDEMASEEDSSRAEDQKLPKHVLRYRAASNDDSSMEEDPQSDTVASAEEEPLILDSEMADLVRLEMNNGPRRVRYRKDKSGVPDRPRQPSIWHSGRKSIILSWSPPKVSDKKELPDGYMVELKEPDGNYRVVGIPQEPFIKLEHSLEPGNTYYFKISSRGENGNSSPLGIKYIMDDEIPESHEDENDKGKEPSAYIVEREDGEVVRKEVW